MEGSYKLSIKLLRDYNVLDRVFLPITYYLSIVRMQLMHCTRLACVTHYYSIHDLVCLAPDGLDKGGVTYLKIAPDEMFNISDIVITLLQ